MEHEVKEHLTVDSVMTADGDVGPASLGHAVAKLADSWNSR